MLFKKCLKMHKLAKCSGLAGRQFYVFIILLLKNVYEHQQQQKASCKRGLGQYAVVALPDCKLSAEKRNL